MLRSSGRDWSFVRGRWLWKRRSRCCLSLVPARCARALSFRRRRCWYIDTVAAQPMGKLHDRPYSSLTRQENRRSGRNVNRHYDPNPRPLLLPPYMPPPPARTPSPSSRAFWLRNVDSRRRKMHQRTRVLLGRTRMSSWVYSRAGTRWPALSHTPRLGKVPRTRRRGRRRPGEAHRVHPSNTFDTIHFGSPCVLLYACTT